MLSNFAPVRTFSFSSADGDKPRKEQSRSVSRPQSCRTFEVFSVSFLTLFCKEQTWHFSKVIHRWPSDPPDQRSTNFHLSLTTSSLLPHLVSFDWPTDINTVATPVLFHLTLEDYMFNCISASQTSLPVPYLWSFDPTVSLDSKHVFMPIVNVQSTAPFSCIIQIIMY